MKAKLSCRLEARKKLEGGAYGEALVVVEGNSITELHIGNSRSWAVSKLVGGLSLDEFKALIDSLVDLYGQFSKLESVKIKLAKDLKEKGIDLE